MIAGHNNAILGFKLFSDGSLGARTAALQYPYSDDPNNSGMLYYDKREICDYATRVKALGLVLATHVIGDKEIALVLEAYKAAGIGKADGFRIEHCSVVRKEFLADLDAFVVSVQPSFSTSDYWINDRLGGKNEEKIPYPLKTLMRSTLVVGGSDSPFKSNDPISGICSAAANPIENERISAYEAANLYTKNAARISRLTARMGKFSRGYEGNVMVLGIQDPKNICNAK